MQKSKTSTIILIGLLTLFFFICQNFLINFGKWYSYFIMPICFIGLAAIFSLLLPSKLVVKRNRRELIEYVVITNLIYIIIYLLSGLKPGFGKNPLDTSITGFLFNIISNVPVIVSLEIIRYRLISNVYKKDKNIIFVLIVMSFSIWDINTRNLFNTSLSMYSIYSLVFFKIIPTVILNVLFTYIALNGDYIPSIVYRIVMGLFLWITPILPKLPDVFDAILSTVIPFFLILYIRYYINLRDRNKSQTNIYEENPRSLIPFTIVLILAIWFTLGAFPIKPFGVATNSMYPKYKIGDMVITNDIDTQKYKIGDVIAYKLENQTIVHRIQRITKDKNGNFVFITKGDYNEDKDFDPVNEEQVIGKVIFKIRYAALPTIWLHSVYSERADVLVETGKDIWKGKHGKEKII